MRFSVFNAVAFAALAQEAIAASNQDWTLQSIYQVITDRFALPDGSTTAPCTLDRYCGGTWAGLIKQLDYIQGMGFTAIQISPVSKNIANYTTYGDAFHGYWVDDLYTLNAHFGTPDDLKSLSTELHNRGMLLMVDVVVNNLAQALPHNGSMPLPIDYSVLEPFNKQDYYHPYCNITDWNNSTNYQNCWLDPEVVALPDLKTETTTVQNMLNTWVEGLIANYSIDGLRIDGAKQINNDFFKTFNSAAKLYTMGEVYDGDVGLFCPYQQFLLGLENYPLFDPIIQAFTAGQMQALSTAMKQIRSQCKDITALSTFIENQDQTRFASLTPDLALAKNALAFVLMADGIPKIYYGQEQHFTGNYSPYNRQDFWPSKYNTNAPLYNLTATLNTLRNHAISIDSRYASNLTAQLYVDGSTIATQKGVTGVQIVSVFSNQGSKGGKYNLQIPHGFPPGTQVIDVLTCTKTTANEVGNITVPMGAGEPHVFFPVDQMNNSGLCGFQGNGTTAKGNSSSSSGNSTSTHKNSASERVGGGISTVAFAFALFGVIMIFG